MIEYKIFKDSFIIIIFAAIIGFSFNAFNPKGFVLISKSDAKLKKIVEISSHEALVKFQAKSALFIDARDAEDYQLSHVRDAINVLVDDEEIDYTENKFNYPELNTAKEFVIYCGGVNCGLSKELAEKFIKLGYVSHIYVIKKGFPEWEENNYPIDGVDYKEKK